jgi:hypothetical protein
MQLPGADRAVVDVRKLRDYVLNPLHPRGRHKARAFASALEIVQSDAELLRQWLLRSALTGEAVPRESDQYGQRYVLDFECVKGERRAIVRSGWIVLSGEAYPRMTTCFVLSE